jgi:hypothetical protein
MADAQLHHTPTGQFSSASDVELGAPKVISYLLHGVALVGPFYKVCFIVWVRVLTRLQTGYILRDFDHSELICFLLEPEAVSQRPLTDPTQYRRYSSTISTVII